MISEIEASLSHTLEISTTELAHGTIIHLKAHELFPELDLNSIDIAIVREHEISDARDVLSPNGMIICFSEKDISDRWKHAPKNDRFNFLLSYEFEFGSGIKYEKFHALFLSDGIVNKNKIDDSDAISRDMTLINLVTSLGDEETMILLTDQRFLSFYYFMKITHRKIIMPIENNSDFQYILE